ncbi:MAG: 4-vinyl reductase [Aquificae bacterium]|nr:4-vinyl reductase [Aquificota bacterium]
MDGLIEYISKVRRPTLGEEVPLLIFRAFRLFTEMYLEDTLGNRGTVALLQNAGRQLGHELAKRLNSTDLKTFLDNVAHFVKSEKVGILIPEELQKDKLIVSLDECITCAGMPNIGKRICHFEAGLIGGILEEHLKKRVKVSETKCNAMGEGICQITAEW